MGIDPSRCFLFLRSALGCLFATIDDKTIACIDPHGATVVVVERNLAPTYVAMDVFSMNNLLDEKSAKAPPREKMCTLVPSLAEREDLDRAKLEAVDFVAGSLRLAQLRGGRLATYAGLPRLAGGGKGAKTAARTTAKAAAKAAARPPSKKGRVETVAFESAALHMLVLANLWQRDAIDRAEVADVLASVRARGEDADEDDLIAQAMAALARFGLPADAARRLDALAFVPAFETEFERRLGLDLGGEGDYRQLDSLAGLDKLPALQSLDLRSLSLPYGPAIDVTPLASHPALRSITLGHGLVKGANALAEIPTLERVVLPAGAPQLDANKKLAALLVAGE